MRARTGGCPTRDETIVCPPIVPKGIVAKIGVWGRSWFVRLTMRAEFLEQAQALALSLTKGERVSQRSRKWRGGR